ncbi:MAG TPA: protein tyrosine phosphatase family protein [Blastocatellia bacterium]|nr:protein tyrosine phosphatase family protein [Blastocatellia bacterium]
MKTVSVMILALVALCGLSTAGIRQERAKLDQIQAALKDDVPRILCVDERFATAGQPKDSAFAKLAENGYRSVLSLRTGSEGIDIAHEKEMVEKSGMRFINIPVVSSEPKPEQVTEFIKAVKEKANQPMLIHCGSANRVGAFWMIYRVVDQGWDEQKALEEAIQIGLTSAGLKTFAHEYIASQSKKAKSG